MEIALYQKLETAFPNTQSIREITFSVNSIQYISANAFDFQSYSDNVLLINLVRTQLDENCLENGVFQSPLRKMKLDLSINSKKILES